MATIFISSSAVTNHHKPSDLNNTNLPSYAQIYHLTVLEVRVQNQFHWSKIKVPQGLVPSGDSENTFLIFSSF